MQYRVGGLLACALLLARALPAQVLQVGDLNTRQILALNRAHTVVILPGGMLEEHGPYLPAFTDGILSARLTSELAQGIVQARPAWTVLVFPPVSVGASGSNEIGGQYSFPGTFVSRPLPRRAAVRLMGRTMDRMYGGSAPSSTKDVPGVTSSASE
jgi:creatinine amidohydrolase/Fe(II)-dependent formamide hydrolase-like protein